MNNEDFQIDFNYLYTSLKAHPLLLRSEKMMQFNQLYETARIKISDYISFIYAMTELTAFFQDGHTNIELLYTKQDDCLHISCEWNDEETLVFKRKLD